MAPGRFRRSLRQPLNRNQTPGTIKISHGIIVTITVIREAVLSARTEPDSRKAVQISAKPPVLTLGLSTLKEITTAIFSVSLAKIFRSVDSPSN